MLYAGKKTTGVERDKKIAAVRERKKERTKERKKETNNSTTQHNTTQHNTPQHNTTPDRLSQYLHLFVTQYDMFRPQSDTVT